MRHRGWMIALSVLGSFLTLPVIWLICISNIHYHAGSYLIVGRLDDIYDVVVIFWENINYLVGAMSIGGALVAALAGFRFVFHKDQVDTWHSLPVKRDTLFWACYVNGIIVWLLPLLIGMILTVVLSGGVVLGKWGGSAELVCEAVRLAAGNFAVWTVVFLLVYDLVLLAMMFSGNVLNTMVSMLIMGFGSGCLYVLDMGLCEHYLDTFYYIGSGNALGAMYASPFVSVVILLLERGKETEGYSVWLNLLIAAVMAVCAWLLYRRRPSELAEQGIMSRGFSTALRLVTTLGAGVAGWIFFAAMTNDDIVWCVFGALLAAVLVHGILDVVFRMDFRAFFAHKLQMAGIVTAVLLVCFAFYGDWFGYDAYLPKKEQIAEIGVAVESLSNRQNAWMEQYSAMAMRYQDPETAYAFLQKMTGAYDGRWPRTESVEVRVTLKNGRTYYRRYRIGVGERELLMPIVSSEEHLKYAYCLNESVAENLEVILQPVRGRQYFAEKKYAKGELLAFLRAYNQDVLEEPETVLLGEGRILAEITLSSLHTDGDRSTVNLSIYESMERTIEALKALGYEELVTPLKTAEIASVCLRVDDFGVYRTAEDIVEAARKKYQVYGGENSEGQAEESVGVQNGEGRNEDGENAEDGQTEEEAGSEVTAAAYAGIPQSVVTERRKDLELNITAPEEIEELLPLISYSDGYKRWRVFKKPFLSIEITDREGETVICYIKEGDLPEKYIQRFGELIQDMEK